MITTRNNHTSRSQKGGVRTYLVILTPKGNHPEPEVHIFSKEESAKYFYDNLNREEDFEPYEIIELLSYVG